jgi:hypothetical protein
MELRWGGIRHPRLGLVNPVFFRNINNIWYKWMAHERQRDRKRPKVFDMLTSLIII